MPHADPVEPPEDHPLAAHPPQPLTCSAKGCRQPARWALHWRNPKLHDEARRKTWLACDEHRTTLGAFLGARGFLRDTEALG